MSDDAETSLNTADFAAVDEREVDPYGPGVSKHLHYAKVHEPGEIREIQDEEHTHIHDITFKEQRRVSQKFWIAVLLFCLLIFCVVIVCVFTVTWKRERKFQAHVILNEIYRDETYGDKSSYAYRYITDITIESFSAVLDDSGIDYKRVDWIDLKEDPDGIIVRVNIIVVVDKPAARQTHAEINAMAWRIHDAFNNQLSSTALGSLGTGQFWIQFRDPPDATLECPDDTTIPTDVARPSATISLTSLPQPTVQEINGEIPSVYRLVGSDDPGEVLPLGTTKIRYRVIYTNVGNGGAMAECDFNIDIQDQEGPIIFCPDDARRTPNNQVIWSPPVVYDNVSEMKDIMSVSTPTNDTIIDQGTRVVYQVRDQAGNVASCDFTIDV